METQKIQQEFVTSKEAARLLGISVRFIQKLCSENRMPYYKFGTALRFKKGDLIRWANENKFVNE